VPALAAAFTQLRQEGATELILDLRYNGGGLLSVAQHLGSLIGGMQESSLAEALHYVQAGACSAAASTWRGKLVAARRVKAPHTETGWQQLVGAY
jgi:hypothetical protein